MSVVWAKQCVTRNRRAQNTSFYRNHDVDALSKTTCREWFRRFKTGHPWQEDDAVHLVESSRCCVI
ncbi:hypothetical protein JGG50_25230 [Salmonella enterica subsp. enterica serovar Typhimurium]|nr:hypothetical protein [Salmonella enterica subsp. enterica serovar Typhimurium]